MKTSGLGRGLSALLNSNEEESKAPIKRKNTVNVSSHNKIIEKKPAVVKNDVSEDDSKSVEYKYIDINKISLNPYQPRKEFDETSITELSQAISRSGFITPILVNKAKDKNGYVLVAGERRLRACKKLNLSEIPAIVKNLTDSQMMQIAIIENVQRKNLNPIEEAKAFQNMRDLLNQNPEEIANSIGLPHYYVVQKLKLTKLPEIVQRNVSNGELSEGAAIALLKLDSDDAIIAASKIAVRQHMSRASVEKLVEKILLSKGMEPSSPDYHFKSKYQYFNDLFKDTLGWNMKIKGGLNGKGKIEIEFLDEMDLKDIYKKLEKVLD